MSFPTIVSFYTPKTGYEHEIKGLIESCQNHNLPYSIDPIPNFGTWEKNCCFKPKYILKKLTDIKGPILWLDADALVVQKPPLFDNLTVDIAVFGADDLPDDHPSKVISGTLFVNYTEPAIKLLKEWDEETERLLKEDPHLWDQLSLRNVLLKSKAKIQYLDDRYYKVFDKLKDEEELKKSFFLHFQASRTLKKTLNKEVAPFWNEETFVKEKKTLLKDLPT